MNNQNQQFNHQNKALYQPIKGTECVKMFDWVSILRSLAQAVYVDESTYDGFNIGS